MKKKKILLTIIILFTFFITGCVNNNLTAKEAVRDYLELYVTLDDRVVDQLDDYVNQEDFTEVQKNTYKEILKKQYTSLNYTFIDEKYEEDKAYITAKINVLDLVGVQKEATKHLQESPLEFNNEDGSYNKSKFLDYKLDLMKNVTDKTEYEIEFKVIKEKNEWVVSQLSNDDLLKIHGAYEE
ncbi:MAG TPA: hypothetical protein DCE23_02390 [Firmicutes bacterium]|nr:hypothetical protein [Bacillota bacterium]